MKNIKIAITGGIGSGKSEVAKIINQKGYTVLNADLIAKEIMNKLEIKNRVAKKFSLKKDENGNYCRTELAAAVFNDKEALKWLDNYIHPLVKKEMSDIMNAAKGLIFAEVPLLFESGMETMFDYTVCVWAPECRSAGLADRSALQLPVGRKLELSDFALINNDGLDQLYRQCAALADQIDNMVV